MINLFILFLSLLSLSNFLPVLSPVQEMVAASWIYLLCFHLFTVPFLLKQRRYLLGLFGFFALVQYGVQFTHLYWPSHKYAEKLSENITTKTIKILYFNSYIENRNTAPFDEIVSRINPDIVMLLESDSDWVKRCQSLKSFPHSAGDFEKEVWSMGVFSKIPFTASPRVELGDDIQPVITGSFALLPPLNFALIHTAPPHTPQSMQINRKIIRRLATNIRHSLENWIVVGDFNSTPFGRTYESLIEAARVDDATEGYGMLKTWPTFIPFFGFHLDRIFVKNAVQLQSVSTVAIAGSDHLGLFFEIIEHTI